MGFTLDTSGEVVVPAIIAITGEPDMISLTYRWSDLTPFQQGYVEALFASPDPREITATSARTGATRAVLLGEWAGFRHLSHEALETIIKDCERYRSYWPERANDKLDGELFQRMRQRGDYVGGLIVFSPLAVTLSDDGKIHLRAA